MPIPQVAETRTAGARAIPLIVRVLRQAFLGPKSQKKRNDSDGNEHPDFHGLITPAGDAQC